MEHLVNASPCLDGARDRKLAVTLQHQAAPEGRARPARKRLHHGGNVPQRGLDDPAASGGLGEGVDVMDLALPVLRTQVALVTQEHHVFVGTLRDNIVLAREQRVADEQVLAALAAVDAGWVDRSC